MKQIGKEFRRRFRFIFLIIFLLIIFFYDIDIIYAQQIGDRAVGMSGAYTAITDDTSSAWYNPAGLVHVKGPAVSISATAYQYKAIEYTDFMSFREKDGFSNASYSANVINTFPTTISYGQSFGSGKLRHAIGFGVFVPFSEEESGSLQYENSPGSFKTTYEISNNVSDYYTSLAYAIQYGNVSVGIAPLFRFYDRSYSTQVYEISDIESQIEYIYSRNFSEVYRHLSLIPAIGLQTKLSNGLSFGIMIKVPNQKIYGQVDVTRVTTVAGSDIIGGIDEHRQVHDNAELDAILKTPTEINFGIGYEKADKYSIALDVRYSGKIDPYLDRDPLLNDSSEFEHNLIQKDAGWDINLGFEYYLSKSYILRMGFFTQFAHHASLTSVVANASDNNAAGDHYEDILGVNLGFATKSSSLTTSYTLSISRGQGKGIGFLTRPPGLEGFSANIGDPIHEKSIQEIDTKFWQVALIISSHIFGQEQ